MASEWIKCSERMPDEGERVLIAWHFADGDFVSIGVRVGESTFTDGDFGTYPNVTHWRPLPDPPEVA